MRFSRILRDIRQRGEIRQIHHMRDERGAQKMWRMARERTAEIERVGRINQRRLKDRGWRAELSPPPPPPWVRPTFKKHSRRSIRAGLSLLITSIHYCPRRWTFNFAFWLKLPRPGKEKGKPLCWQKKKKNSRGWIKAAAAAAITLMMSEDIPPIISSFPGKPRVAQNKNRNAWHQFRRLCLRRPLSCLYVSNISNLAPSRKNRHKKP